MSYKLAKSIRDIKDYLARGSEDGFIGMDSETSGLDTRRAMIAGVSLSVEEDSGIYIPLGHTIGSNLPMKGVVDALKDVVGVSLIPVFYNAKYDLNVIQKNTKWYPKKFEDALEVVYMEDPDRKMKNLKLVAKEDLLFNMDSFESLFTPEEIKAKSFDIRRKLPQRCVDYACADADAALRIWRLKIKTREEQAFAIKIDTKLIEIVRRIEHNGGMELNHDYIDDQIGKLEARVEALREQIHRIAGYKFEINSPKQLGIALFDKMGIPSPGLTRGKNPQHRTDAESMEKLAKQYPEVSIVLAYRKVVKARSTYFMKLKKLDSLGLPVRFQFNMFSAPTFRFSAPGGRPEVDGGSGVNIQAVSNGEALDLMAVDLSIEGGDDEYLENLGKDQLLFDQEKEVDEWLGPAVDSLTLPYTIEDESEPPKLMCFRETCAKCPARCRSKGIDITRRLQKNLKMIPSVRQSFRAKEGYTLVSFDYIHQELVIGANMSKEPKWLRALANKEDLHELTASDAFGIPLDDYKAMKKDPNKKGEYKRKRDIGKILNFASFYGATSYTLARKADIAQVQADKIYEGFTNGLKVLFQWMSKVHIFARKEGYTTTYFGRKRWLKQFYAKNDRKMNAFADRSAVNTAIQG
ncbi:MAG TPA: hypothetical protein ENI23_11905, partial [bacterium]|nr:hypothetical protein [bacterium]